MDYKIILTNSFERELNYIMEFYTSKNSVYSKKLFFGVKNLILSLKQFPERFSIINEDFPNKEKLNLRQCVFEHYRIIYQIKEKNIYILTILGQNLIDCNKFIIN